MAQFSEGIHTDAFYNKQINRRSKTQFQEDDLVWIGRSTNQGGFCREDLFSLREDFEITLWRR